MLLKNRRIFYIEDNAGNRAITQMILEQAGATIGFERWGQNEVISRLEAFMPLDLILLDLMFPRGVTGYEVFDAIRTYPAFGHVPIVAVSASDSSIEVPRTQAKGFAGFISKPISLAEFPKQIFSLLNGEPVWA